MDVLHTVSRPEALRLLETTVPNTPSHYDHSSTHATYYSPLSLYLKECTTLHIDKL